MPRRDKPTALSKALGARIKHLREEIGLTQEKLAYESGLQSKGFLSDVEKGLALPTLGTLELLAERLEVEVFDLFTFPEQGHQHKVVDKVRGMSATEIKALLRQLADAT